MPIVSLYAVNIFIWMLTESLSRYPYKGKPFGSAIYSAGVAASSVAASAGAASVAACSTGCS